MIAEGMRCIRPPLLITRKRLKLDIDDDDADGLYYHTLQLNSLTLEIRTGVKNLHCAVLYRCYFWPILDLIPVLAFRVVNKAIMQFWLHYSLTLIPPHE